MATEYSDKEMKRVLVFGGKSGWIGGLMVDLCKEQGKIRSIVFDSIRFVFCVHPCLFPSTNY